MKAKALITALTVALACSAAHAAFTPIGSSGEADIDTVLDNLYGAGVWSTTNVLWSNGTVTATRVQDYLTGGDPITPGTANNLVFGGGYDQIWTDGYSQFTGRVRFAGYDQRFGIDFGADGTTNQQLLNVIGNGYDGALSGTLTASWTFAANSTWGWYRDGTTTDFSQAVDNPDAASMNVWSDHMITYQITGLTDPQYAGRTVWLLMWDDQTNPSSDRDFNDLGIEITAAIPAPGAVVLGLLGLGLVGWVVKRRLN